MSLDAVGIRSGARSLLWPLGSGIVGAVLVFVLLVAVVRQGPHAHTGVGVLVILFSIAMILVLAATRPADWTSWLAAHAGVVAGAAVAIILGPRWSGYIAVALLLLLVTVPGLSYWRAHRLDHALSRQEVRFLARLACVLHPSRPMRFQMSLLATQTLASIAAKLEAYRELGLRMPERSAEVQCWIAMDQDDWKSALARAAGMKFYEIRALGELRRLDEMIAAYLAAQSIMPLNELLASRLFVLAFCGRLDAVRALLRDWRLAARHKAFWTFVAARAAGADDAEAQRALVAHAHAAADETFHKRVRRHLGAPPLPEGALSAASSAAIAMIEESLRSEQRTASQLNQRRRFRQNGASGQRRSSP